MKTLPPLLVTQRGSFVPLVHNVEEESTGATEVAGASTPATTGARGRPRSRLAGGDEQASLREELAQLKAKQLKEREEASAMAAALRKELALARRSAGAAAGQQLIDREAAEERRLKKANEHRYFLKSERETRARDAALLVAQQSRVVVELEARVNLAEAQAKDAVKRKASTRETMARAATTAASTEGKLAAELRESKEALALLTAAAQEAIAELELEAEDAAGEAAAAAAAEAAKLAREKQASKQAAAKAAAAEKQAAAARKQAAKQVAATAEAAKKQAAAAEKDVAGAEKRLAAAKKQAEQRVEEVRAAVEARAAAAEKALAAALKEVATAKKELASVMAKGVGKIAKRQREAAEEIKKEVGIAPELWQVPARSLPEGNAPEYHRWTNISHMESVMKGRGEGDDINNIADALHRCGYLERMYNEAAR